MAGGLDLLRAFEQLATGHRKESVLADAGGLPHDVKGGAATVRRLLREEPTRVGRGHLVARLGEGEGEGEVRAKVGITL